MCWVIYISLFLHAESTFLERNNEFFFRVILRVSDHRMFNSKRQVFKMKFDKDKIERAMLDWLVGVKNIDISQSSQVMPHLHSTFDYLLKLGLVKADWYKDFEGAAFYMDVMKQVQG